jgi:hypothetical protein
MTLDTAAENYCMAIPFGQESFANMARTLLYALGEQAWHFTSTLIPLLLKPLMHSPEVLFLRAVALSGQWFDSREKKRPKPMG